MYLRAFGPARAADASGSTKGRRVTATGFQDLCEDDRNALWILLVTKEWLADRNPLRILLVTKDWLADRFDFDYCSLSFYMYPHLLH
jgi:hypothetical protein